MKTLLLSFLFIAGAFAIQAQDAKPTKDKTIEYILNSLKDYKTTKIIEAGGDPNVSVNWEINKIAFSDCIVAVTMIAQVKIPSAPNYGSITKSEITFNLKDIEEIEFSTNDYGMGSLVLKSLNEAKLINLKETKNGEFTNTDVTSIGIFAPSRDKLVQAFNHLRKLCGAPEPIKF